jgi:hypothetical protein
LVASGVRLLDLFGVQFNDTLDRATTVSRFSATLTGSNLADLLLLAGSGAACAIMIGYKLRAGRIRDVINWDTFLALTVAGSVLGLAAMASWLLYPLTPSPVYQGSYWTLALLVDQVFQALGVISPFLVILVILPWAVWLGVKSMATLTGRAWRAVDPATPARRWTRPDLLLVSTASMLLVLGAFYPYLAGINPDHASVSVDVPRYLAWVGPALRATDLTSWVRAIFTPAGATPGSYAGDLPLYLVFLQGVSGLTGGVQAALDYMPLLLGALLAASSFWAMQAWKGNLRLSSLAALFSVYSYQVLAGIYSGFFANWFAVALLNTMIGFLIVDWRRPSKASLLAVGLLSAGVFLAHPYTWLVAAAALAGTAMWESFPSIRSGRLAADRRLGGAVVALGAGAVTGLVQAEVFGFNALNWGASEVSSSAIGLTAFASRSFNIAVSLNYLYAGLLNNPILLILVVFWVATPKGGEFGTKYVLAWLSLSAIPVLFGTATIQSRTLYDLPLQFPAAIGLYSLSGRLEERRRWAGAALVALVVIIETDFFLRSLANMVPAP